jgi:hypothetical protein
MSFKVAIGTIIMVMMAVAGVLVFDQDPWTPLSILLEWSAGQQ